MNYDDIINLPHHVSAKRKPMSLYDRAAQFAPFAALSGHGAAVDETARLTDRKIELDEYEINELDRKLNQINDMLKDLPRVTFVYFVPDAKKNGGSYITVTEKVKKIDEYERLVVLADETKIPIDNIFDISIEE